MRKRYTLPYLPFMQKLIACGGLVNYSRDKIAARKERVKEG